MSGFKRANSRKSDGILRLAMLQKMRHPASEALVTLRAALGMTQSEFSRNILSTSKITLARYETSHPPSGDLLLRLAAIAAKHGQRELQRTFQILYYEELFKQLGGPRLTVIATTPPKGYLMLELIGAEELKAGELLMSLRGSQRAY